MVSSGKFVATFYVSVRHIRARHIYAGRTWKMHKIGGFGVSPKMPVLGKFFKLAEIVRFFTLFLASKLGNFLYLNFFGLFYAGRTAEFTRKDDNVCRNMPDVRYIYIPFHTHFGQKMLRRCL